MVTLSWNYYKETFLSQSMIDGRDICILSNDGVPTYISKLFLLIYSRNLTLLTMEHNFCGCGVIFITVPASSKNIHSLCQLLSKGMCQLDNYGSEIFKLIETMGVDITIKKLEIV